MLYSLFPKRVVVRLAALLCLSFLAVSANAQTDAGKAIYDKLKAFQLTGGAVEVNNLVLKRDRVEMAFTGKFYFAEPIQGIVTGAVFIGNGTLKADVPDSEFERDNLKRLLDADSMESDFKTAVLRFTDETFDLTGKGAKQETASTEAIKLAAEHEPRMLKETAANLSSRVALSLINGEMPGIFIGTFDGGKRGRFTYLFDPQTRIPTNYFNVNGGEKGMIFSYKSSLFLNDVWMAFYSLRDYQERVVEYSDLYNIVDVSNYNMDLDLTEPRTRLGLRTKVSMASRFSNVRMVNFNLGESLSEYESQRLKKQMRTKKVTMNGQELRFAQEDWEGGVSVFLPKAMQKDEKFELEFEIEGDFMRQPDSVNDVHYPRSNETWYPRHGYLDRSTFETRFMHPKKLKVATGGTRTGEIPNPDKKDWTITTYSMKYPIALATFALGPWERYREQIKWDNGSKPIPLEFNSMPGVYAAIKEDFIAAEMNNAVRYFQALFGDYPYDTFGATFHPYGFGQGFATMLMIPNTDRASKYTYSFLSHETAHQWWGNIVAWRSYRDQWLSEGFAEYSGVLYTSFRENPKAALSLVDQMRREIKEPPYTPTGIGKGRLNDIGPIILGGRLNTSKSFGAYQALIYAKGGLVLRMLHFLFTDPATGNDKLFYDMMKAFVEKHRNAEASTDDFRAVANEYFVQTPISKKYGVKDLNWFFSQWVYKTNLPSYKLEYQIEDQPDGTAVVSGNVIQENAGEKWFMPMPMVMSFGGDKKATGTVAAFGPKQPFKIPLPQRPQKVELDPNKWILSEKTQ